ncbi:glycosyltransferase, partial [Candidatus Parcubacteria bacterium]|nr:glycosyltransferase [Candidatus Parcubacteria bacterium]
MRIGLFTACYKPTVNGVVYHIEELKNWLEKMGQQVFVFAPKTRDYRDEEKDVIRYPSLPNPKIKSYPLGAPFLIPRREIERLNLDIIHVHHPFVVGDFAAEVARQIDKPLVFTHHTQYALYSQCYLPAQLREVAPKIVNRVLHRFLKKCDAVICPTGEIALRIKESLPQVKTAVIPNGINIKLFFPIQTRKKKQIIYIGRVGTEKNIGQLLDVFQEINRVLPNYQLVIAGGGPYLEEARAVTQRLRLQPRVRFLGAVPRGELPQLLSQSSLFITLSQTEVMPLTAIEAAACGLPVVASRLPSFTEIFPHQKGAVLLEEQADFAPAVIDLLQNGKKLKKLSSEAREAA